MNDNLAFAKASAKPDSVTKSDNFSSPAASRLLVGTMVATDIEVSRAFYEDFFGFECVRYAPGRLLLRDAYAKAAMESGSDDFFLIDVQQVDAIENPQKMLHHWGFDVESPEVVDHIHAEAKSNKEKWGITKLFPLSDMHGAHSFYFADRDSNWWEIEYRTSGLDNHGIFERGDIDLDVGALPFSCPKRFRSEPAGFRDCIIGPAELTHGTCEQLDMANARRFLGKVLNLRTVRHEKVAQMLAGRGSFSVFAVGLPRLREQGRQNRWIVVVDSIDEVATIRDRAIGSQEDLGIKEIGRIEDIDGRPACVIQDGDGNWWEVACQTPDFYRELFERGDVEIG